MSAIGGIIAFNQPEKPLKEFVEPIFSKLKHRGTQDEGYVFFRGNRSQRFSGEHTNVRVREYLNLPHIHEADPESWMFLGHRLGTIYPDVHPKAHQPFSNHEQAIWAVLDGEIFNAVELSRQLRDEGQTIETDDPVEVLVKGYQVWQERILARLDGSFSFLLFDARENKILAARDPFGIKPFYYTHQENIFAFGSELKSLIGLPFVSKKISKSAVFDYLILGESESNIQSMFRGLSELMPGSALSILLPKGNMRIWTYFQLTTDSKIDRYSRNKVSTLGHRLRKSLVENVSNHLSPGYETAYRLAPHLEALVFPYLLKESIREMRPQDRVPASGIYSTLHSSAKENDPEIPFLESLAQDLGVDFWSSVCSFRDFSENLLKVVYAQDVPFSSLEVFSQYKMFSEAASKGIKIIVDPLGGSQLFAGETRHFHQFLLDILARGQYSLFTENLFNAPGSLGFKLGTLFQVSKKMLFRSTADDIKETLFRRNQEEFSYIKDHFKDQYAKNLENSIKRLPDSLNQLLLNEFGASHVKEGLRTADRNAQGLGVEVRFPFVSDRSLAESMLKSNSVYKIRGGQTGNLLQRAMRGLCPENLQQHSLPLQNGSRENHWLEDARQELKEFITPDLDDFIDSRELRKDWDQLMTNPNPKRAEFLWRVVNLGVWRHVYFHQA
jgi:asparagine synthase (glutamine-hydrolysing)